jgi:hypothetical protein
MVKSFKFLGLLLGVYFLVGCSTASRVLNPFYEEPAPEAYLGERNDHALDGDKTRADDARQALQQMATYERANPPSPYKPVIKPAVVRLMWIPDHVNRHGDLVPAHYYYVKVLKDNWNVTDAFELEAQLNQGSKRRGSVPFVPAK